jgi:hypothetical protein
MVIWSTVAALLQRVGGAHATVGRFFRIRGWPAVDFGGSPRGPFFRGIDGGG